MEPATEADRMKLKPIYDRWQHTPIPPDLAELAAIEFKTPSYLHSQSLTHLLDHGLMSDTTVGKLMRAWDEVLKYSIMGTIFVGLELARRMNVLRGPAPADDVVMLRLDLEEFGVIDASIETVASLLEVAESLPGPHHSTQRGAFLKKLRDVQRAVHAQAQESSAALSTDDLRGGLQSALAFGDSLATMIQEVLKDWYNHPSSPSQAP